MCYGRVAEFCKLFGILNGTCNVDYFIVETHSGNPSVPALLQE